MALDKQVLGFNPKEIATTISYSTETPGVLGISPDSFYNLTARSVDSNEPGETDYLLDSSW